MSPFPRPSSSGLNHQPTSQFKQWHLFFNLPFSTFYFLLSTFYLPTDSKGIPQRRDWDKVPVPASHVLLEQAAQFYIINFDSAGVAGAGLKGKPHFGRLGPGGDAAGG